MKKVFQAILVAPLVLVAGILAVPLFCLAILGWMTGSLAVSLAVLIFWLPRGVRFLVVYSESAQWQEYFEDVVIPALAGDARVLNLSRVDERPRWWHLRWRIYRHVAGYRNRFPIVVRFSVWGTWTVVRFYDAFMLAKRNQPEALIKAKKSLEAWQHSTRERFEDP